MNEKKKTVRIITASVVAVLSVLFVFFALPRLILLFLPFVIGYILAKLIEPAVNFLNKKLRIPRAISSGLMVLIVVGTLVWVVIFLGNRIFTELSSLIKQSDIFVEKISQWFAGLQTLLFERFNFDFAKFMEDNVNFGEMGKKAGEYIFSYIVPTFEGAVSIVKRIPSIIIFTVALIMGTFFMSSDKDLLVKNTRNFVPAKVMKVTDSLRNDMLTALVGYIRAQLVLICITFFELTVGFVIIGGTVADYALLLALIVAVIDAVPILGTGTVLIPWAVYSFLMGETRMGVMLLILYIVCLLVRQMLEPRIVGVQIGLHPLATLIVMYVGLKLFGFFGMIFGPVIALILKNLYQAGTFSTLWQFIVTGDVSSKENPPEK